MTANSDFILIIATIIAVYTCLFVQLHRHNALARRVAMMEALHRAEDEDQP